MASETQAAKRLRDEPSHEEFSSSHELDDSAASNSKRQRPYNTILNLLDEEEPSHEPSHELSQDLSAIFTTLQKELASSTSCDSTTTVDFDTVAVEGAELSRLHATSADEDEGGKSDVMRHLLEASDDELGIPNRRDGNNNVDEIFNSGENLPFGFTDLWELEDETANYYTVLQSELFM